MTKKEYLKYNNPEAFDIQGKPIESGDTVVINNYYGAFPYIGIVDHFTQSGLLAICYNYKAYSKDKTSDIKCWAYRTSDKVIKIKNGNSSKNKDQGQS